MLEAFKQALAGLPQDHIHPLVVHFPIALWTVGTVLFLFSLMGWFWWLRTPSIIVGVVGSLFGWLANYTGEMAANLVAPGLCNPALLHQHEQQAETALIFFSAAWGVAMVFQFVQNRFMEGREAHVLIRVALSIALILGNVFLVMAGHKGFRLVFEEGTGVRSASSNCK